MGTCGKQCERDWKFVCEIDYLTGQSPPPWRAYVGYMSPLNWYGPSAALISVANGTLRYHQSRVYGYQKGTVENRQSWKQLRTVDVKYENREPQVVATVISSALSDGHRIGSYSW